MSLHSAIPWSGKREDDGIDIISNLPDHILHHIFSFLSTKDVFRTSILSARWRYLWTSLANLDLVYKPSRRMNVFSFPVFVDRVLAFHDDSDIKRLRVCLCYRPDRFFRLNSWISIAFDHNVEELELILGLEELYCELPCSLFTSSSLILLKIHAKSTLKAPPNTCLSNLKKLDLYGITFSDDFSSQRIFSSCPVLEELTLEYCKWQNVENITISIPTLKTLTIIDAFNYNAELSFLIKFDLCNLPILENVSFKFNYPDSMPLPLDFSDRTGRLVSGICKIKFLTVNKIALQTVVKAKNFPSFYNLTHLEVYADDYDVLKQFLRKTPNLENLKLSGSIWNGFLDDESLEMVPFDDKSLEMAPSCFNSSLKSVAFGNFRGKLLEMSVVEYLLKYATCLESLVISCTMDLNVEKLSFAHEYLQSIPKGSKNCNVEYRFRKPGE